MQRESVLEHLRRVRAFAGCTDDELVAVDSLMQEMYYGAGRTLTRQGDPGGDFVVIAEGHATVEKDGEDVAGVMEGSFVGELSLLDRKPQNATVRAVTAVRAYVLHAADFAKLLERSPTLRAKIERAAVDRR